MYYPDYIDEINSPDDLINGIRNTLELWLMIHTDAETWANEWTQDNDPSILQDIFDNGITNNYFTFDVKDAVLKEWCKDNLNLFVKCENCDYIAEEYYNDYCSCIDDMPEDELSDDRWIECKLDDLFQYINDCGIESVNNGVDYVESALLNEGFKVYREALESYTSSIEDDCKIAIENIDNACNNEDKLFAAMQGASIYHVNGEIMSDYGERVGLSYEDLNKLRSEGLQSFFNSETLKAWLNE